MRLVPIVFFLGYKIVFRSIKGSVSYVLALGLFTMAWLSVLLGYVVVTLATPGADPALAHRLDFLCGGVGFEAATWLDSLIGWGTVLLLAFALISFVVFFFNVTSLNLGSFRRMGTEDDAEEDAEIEAELAAEQAAAARPAPSVPEPAPLTLITRPKPGMQESAAASAATVAAAGARPETPALQVDADEDEEEAAAPIEFEPAPQVGVGVPWAWPRPLLLRWPQWYRLPQLSRRCNCRRSIGSGFLHRNAHSGGSFGAAFYGSHAALTG